MARNFVSASSQYMHNATAIIKSVPLTIVARVKRTTASASQVILSIGNLGSATWDGWYISLGVANTVAAVSTVANSFRSCVSAGTIKTGVWQHVAGVFRDITHRRVYLNGVGAAPEITSDAPTGITGMRVGVGLTSSPAGNMMNGDLAELAVYDVALNPDEILWLSRGVRPCEIRPKSLVGYWPFKALNSPEKDFARGYDLTLINAPIAAVHPPVIYTSRRRVCVGEVEAADGSMLLLNPPNKRGNRRASMMAGMQ